MNRELRDHLAMVYCQRAAGLGFALAGLLLWCIDGTGSGLTCFCLAWVLWRKIPPPTAKLDRMTGRE